MEPGPESSATRLKQSASTWAGTEEGCWEFESQFSFEQEDAFEVDDAGEPHDYIVQSHLPSRDWMMARKDSLARSIEDEEEVCIPGSNLLNRGFPILFSIRAEYYAQLVHAVAANPPSPGTHAHAYGEADRIRQRGYDFALTNNWEALERFCVDVRNLRDKWPPAGKDAWAAILNTFVTMAVEKWIPLLNTTRGRPPPQAMPRAFSRNAPKDVRHDPIGLPRSFKPDGGVYIHRTVKGFRHLTRRQRRCLVTQKTLKLSDPAATLPINIGQWKASRAESDSDQALGQIMYSAVQGAGIFQNCQLSVKVLLLSVGFGWAQPWASSWPGKDSSFDVCLVRGKDLDLGTLKGAISCFLMLYDNAENHILSAFGITREQLSPTTDFSNLDKIPLTPGPIVDWRLRTVPRSFLLKGKGNKMGVEGGSMEVDEFEGGGNDEDSDGDEVDFDGDHEDTDIDDGFRWQ